jgi:hypothetical protein
LRIERPNATPVPLALAGSHGGAHRGAVNTGRKAS